MNKLFILKICGLPTFIKNYIKKNQDTIRKKNLKKKDLSTTRDPPMVENTSKKYRKNKE